MTVEDKLFKFMIFLYVVPCLLAILLSVSPDFTVYVPVDLVLESELDVELELEVLELLELLELLEDFELPSTLSF
ncbi:hypothetical protein GCM10022378_16600 [Salinicoccus jeotgali]|uniref:Uncharacterized protein n=1 Tax=Salinicoccus jeotgali TaxID=381634 RepID=A0ABP7F0M7_9STAP